MKKDSQISEHNVGGNLKEIEGKFSLLDRVYFFFKRLWWLIPMLSIIILILLLLRSCENRLCIDLNNRINNIDSLLNNCNCKELVPCNTATKSGGDGITETAHSLGQHSGTVTINYNMKDVPDKLEVFYENKRVCSTFDIKRNNKGYVGGKNSAGCCNSISFYYPSIGDNFCTVIITGGGSTTEWFYTLRCPK
jgi:hypothetical protein